MDGGQVTAACALHRGGQLHSTGSTGEGVIFEIPRRPQYSFISGARAKGGKCISLHPSSSSLHRGVFPVPALSPHTCPSLQSKAVAAPPQPISCLQNPKRRHCRRAKTIYIAALGSSVLRILLKAGKHRPQWCFSPKE